MTDKEDFILLNIGPKQTQPEIMAHKIPDNLGLELDFVTTLTFNTTVQVFLLLLLSQSFRVLQSLSLRLLKLYPTDHAELTDLLLKQ